MMNKIQVFIQQEPRHSEINNTTGLSGNLVDVILRYIEEIEKSYTPKDITLIKIIEDKCWSNHRLYYAKGKSSKIFLYCPICKCGSEVDNKKEHIKEIKKDFEFLF